MSAATLLVACGLLLHGHAVLALLREPRSRGLLEQNATALMIGLALAPALLASATILAGRALPAGAWLPVFYGLSAIGLVALARNTRRALEVRRARLSEARGREPWNPWHIAGLALLGGFACFALLYAAGMPVHVFDPIYHFAYKGKLIYQEGIATEAWTDLDGAVGRIITHPDYPPGLPALHALVALVGGEFSEDATRPLLALFALCPAAWLWCALRDRGRGPALAAALLWTSLPILYYTQVPNRSVPHALFGLLFGTRAGIEQFPERAPWDMPDGWTLDGAADLPLAAFALGALLYLTRALGPAAGPEGRRADAGIAGLLLAGMVLIKNEGVALVAVLLCALLGARLLARLAGERSALRGPWAPLFGALALAALLGAAWFAVRGQLPVIDEDYPSRLTPTQLWQNRAALGEVALGFAEAFGNALRWNLLWPLFFATLLWSLARPRRLMNHPALPALLFVLGGMLLYFVTLMVTPWDRALLFSTVIPGRLILHLAPATILVTTTLLWRLPEERA